MRRNMNRDPHVSSATASIPMAVLPAKSQAHVSYVKALARANRGGEDAAKSRSKAYVHGQPKEASYTSYSPTGFGRCSTRGLTFSQTTTDDQPTTSSNVPIVHLGRSGLKRRAVISFRERQRRSGLVFGSRVVPGVE